MVSKSLTIIALLMCAILTQTAVAKKNESEDEADDHSDDESSENSDDSSEEEDDDDDDEDIEFPSLSCLIFKDIGCNSECGVISDAFGTKSTGTCDEQKVCECNVQNETSFDDEDAGKFIKNGKPNISAIKKHVSDKLPKTLKSSDVKNLSVLKYKPILLDALEEAKDDSDAFDQLALDIRQTKNKSLGDILSQYLKKNELDEPEKDKQDKPSVADIMAYYVVDELVKKVDDKKSTKVVKKPTKKPAKKAEKTPAKKPSKKSTNKSDSSSLKDRFELEDFDDSALKQGGLVNKNWSGDDYRVSYQRSWGGDVSMNWVKGQDKVSISKAASGAVSQNWNFGMENVKVSISKSAAGDRSENWNFGTSKYQYSRAANGYVSSNWSTGKADNKTLKKYQQMIDAWCDVNDSLIQRSYCVIYKM
ncbi:uncharacterized protein LOC135844363 [Planococcus citri]|uniref:uncharacterized protein LOC135844363 n=1 Tax=Planococcus citri TaxID=170843 RepID=UPI0031F89F34